MPFRFPYLVGKKQRVALARAMMINPRNYWYMMSLHHDPELRLEVEKLILQNKERG